MSTPDTRNLTWHGGLVTRPDREKLLGQRGCVVWLTGLSGSGKSTIARTLEEALVKRGRAAYVLDGDNVRHGLNKDLGFAPQARAENIRRIGEVAALFADAGLIAITAFISPYRAGRDAARAMVPADRFLEVFVHASLGACEDRDPKGLYVKARAGEIGEFTGISAPYEAPSSPELVLKTEEFSVDETALQILSLIQEKGLLLA